MAGSFARSTSSLSAAGLLLVPLLLSGCGSNCQISGKVTYKGKPIPVGSVYITPDDGNSGRSASARVKDGKYTTPAGEGAGRGPMIVQVTGYDGVGYKTAEGGWEPDGRRLFPIYIMKVQLPGRDSVLDIDVP